ncbi:MAG TPA: type IV secretion system DNA-binding domain-containing protein [Candidatus Saccharimonadales bacterium]|nr:type IV secretion system DNA-binding domain-containing protein [Candidatus Saccharimonadales bacterium]
MEVLDILINGPVRLALAHRLDTFWVLIFCIYCLLVELGCLYVCIRTVRVGIRHFHTLTSLFLKSLGVYGDDEPYIFLQLVFPSRAEVPVEVMEQLHLLLRSSVRYPGRLYHLIAPKRTYSLELVATRDEGIQYIIRIPKRERESVKRMITAFSPGMRIKDAEDYLTPDRTSYGVRELRLSHDAVLPLARSQGVQNEDPISYVLGHMTELSLDERIALQIVVSPVFERTHPAALHHIRTIQRNITQGEPVAHLLTGEIRRRDIVLRCILAPLYVGLLGYKFLRHAYKGVRRRRTPVQMGGVYDQEMNRAIKEKLDQPLYEVSIRILAAGTDQRKIDTRLNALTGAFSLFTTLWQSVIVQPKTLLAFSKERKIERFRARRLTTVLHNPVLLSASELASLYHFPAHGASAEGLVKSRSPELVTPLSLRRSTTQLDVIVGENRSTDEVQPIGMTLEQRQKHTYIIGKTGMGKTTLLKHAIYQDMVSGKGLMVLDPHGDLFRELLSIVPEERRDDVVIFDPSDRAYPIGLNILDPGIPFSSDEDRVDWITSAVLSIFRKLSDERQWGPRMEHILRNVTMTALQTEAPNLFTLQRLLTDKKYQKKISGSLTDPVLKQFWKQEFAMLGSMQMASVTAPLTHRLGHFITSTLSRHILLQEKTTLRIADIINEGKLLLVNLSKGDIGEDQSEFFGTILTTLVWMAAYQRTKIPEPERRDFFVYVDEFQNFATPQFAAITSEGRKFHIALIVSHQNIAQIEDKRLVKIVAGNAATIISLRANPEDEAFLLPYMKSAVGVGDIVNLAPHHFFMKVATKDSEEAFSGETIPLGMVENKAALDEVIERSRMQYGVERKVVEDALQMYFGEEIPKNRIGVRRFSKKELTEL